MDMGRNKAAKHVDVWDESDAKTIVILGIISFVLLMAGLSGLSLLITMWAVAAAYFHSKHEKVRKEIDSSTTNNFMNNKK